MGDRQIVYSSLVLSGVLRGIICVVVVVCFWSPGRKACPNYEAVWARTGLLL